MLLKIDLINDAFSKLRISGITVNPSSGDTTLALNRLENMIRELQARNVCVNWSVVDSPDVTDYHNLAPEHYDAVSTLLAKRLVADFGKEVSQSLAMQAGAASSFLYSSTAVKQQTQYPARQPRGRGNRRYHSYNSNFMPSVNTPPTECTETFTMYVNDIQDYTEHFEAYLNNGEDLASFTIEADNGLTVLSSSNTTNDVNYQIRADGSSSDNVSEAWLRVKVVATTTTGRITTRIKNFTLIDVEIA